MESANRGLTSNPCQGYQFDSWRIEKIEGPSRTWKLILLNTDPFST